MSNNWINIRSMVNAFKTQDDVFIALVNEKGVIRRANTTMVKTLHLKKTETSFFDLLHPAHFDYFKKAINCCDERNDPCDVELYLKNGHYHPMKWQVNKLPAEQEEEKTFLCLGHKILDDKRQAEFNKLGEENYQLIVEGVEAGVLFQDRKGELIAVNRKAARIFDTTLERLYQLTDIKCLWNTAWDITDEQGVPVSFDNTPFAKALETGNAQTKVLVIRFRNGEQRWLHFSSQPLFNDKDTQPYAVVSNIADITQEKKLSTKLEEREALFRAFMGKTPNLAWVVDEDHRLVFASQSFFNYFGLNEHTSLDKDIIDLVPKAVADALYEKHLQVLTTGVPAELIEKVRWADGSDFVFHINIFPIKDVSSRKMLGGQAVNLADKYEQERKLREANERLLLLTRAASDAIWEWDMQSGQIFRNDALMEMIGYQAMDEPKGLSWWLRRIHPEDRNRVSDKVKESTDSNQQSWVDEYRFRCADGNYKHMRDRGYIVYENGLPVKMIGSLQDVSNLKSLENQLLEERFERQKELSEIVIRAQEKERTRIGHELHDNVNQVLSTAKLFVDMLTPSCESESPLKQKGIDYILLAIEEIRKLSKELVAPQLRRQDGLINSIQALIDDIRLTGNLYIRFTHDHEGDLLTYGKKVTIFRIIQEQLKNILNHSKAGYVDILLQHKEQETILIIKDDGVGFDPKQTNRGIGLSNIYERARFYNGQVEIRTAPGHGCTLLVSIPFST